MSNMIKPQKALHMFQETDKKKPKYIGHDYMISQKDDGWYGYLDFPSCVIHSRAGREIPALRDFSNAIRKQRPDCKGRLIFEIMIEGLEVDSFHILNGRLNRKSEQCEDVYLRVHDYLPNFTFDMPAYKRYEFASEVVGRLNMPDVRMNPRLGVSNDPAQWHACAEKVWQNGGEGVILKRYDGFYMPEKRNFELMKIKEELTLDLLVTGMYEGEGKYQGTLGGLLVRGNDEITHRVSGMTDEQRDSWWDDSSLIVNKVVEIKAMKKLKDGTLREPRFKCIRYDKLITEID